MSNSYLSLVNTIPQKSAKAKDLQAAVPAAKVTICGYKKEATVTAKK
jgi:hypothetical protein